MSKKLFPLFLALLAGFPAISQTNIPPTQFWVGSGSDSTRLIVDFKDGTVDSSYVWGYLHNPADSATGADLLLAVASADRNFEINIDTASFGYFLPDLNYHSHLGMGGSPNFWGTWDGESYDSLATNLGIGSKLISGGLFGCSYTDFNPNTKPGIPWAAFNPQRLTPNTVTHWFGSGSDSLVLVVDFKDGTDSSSYAWGFLSNDSLNAIDLLDSLAKRVNGLSANLSNGLVSISYKQQIATIGGTSDWYSWTANNHGNWQPHYVQRPKIGNGQMLALVYTRFAELQRPTVPYNINGIGLSEMLSDPINFFPNPATDQITIKGEFDWVKVFRLDGRLELKSTSKVLKTEALGSGVYLLQLKDAKGLRSQQLIIQ